MNRLSLPAYLSTDLRQSSKHGRHQNDRMGVRIFVVISGLWLAACTAGLSDAGLGHPPDGDRVFIEEAIPEQIDAGRRIVELKCVSCHAVRSSDISRDLTAPPLRTLAERYPVTELPEAFAQGVLVGHAKMPDFRFNATQIRQILAYLQSIQTRQGA
jgi:cytochrome c